MGGILAERARELIRELSDPPADDVRFLAAGSDSAAFRVDGVWVVRFPIVDAAQRTLRTELALLPELALRLPVAVPRPEHVGERDGSLVFSAYRALEGEPLSDAALAALSKPARARALDELSSVVDAIHRFPARRAADAGVGLELCKGAYHPGQEELERQFMRQLDAHALDALTRQRRAFEEVQQDGTAPVLLHADIKPAHLLHDSTTGSLTGLLDWGDVRLGHADFDLAIVGAFCGPRTLSGLLERMGEGERAIRHPLCAAS